MKQPVNCVPTSKVWLTLLLFAVCPIKSVQQNPFESKYVGCYVDQFDRILPNYECVENPEEPGYNELCPTCGGPLEDSMPGEGTGCQNPSMDIELCFMVCIQNMFVYAGLEGGNECYCGDATANYEKHVPGSFTTADCSTPCVGNGEQSCGGDSLASVYDLRKSACTVDNLDPLITPSEQTVNVAFDADHTLSFTCAAGYILSGQGSSTCQLDGTWIPSIPTCSDVPDVGDLNANQGRENDVTGTNGNNTDNTGQNNNRRNNNNGGGNGSNGSPLVSWITVLTCIVVTVIGLKQFFVTI